MIRFRTSWLIHRPSAWSFRRSTRPNRSGPSSQSLRAAATWREILVVDDGSSDGTAERAPLPRARASSGTPTTRATARRSNPASANASGDYVLIIDGDGQHSAVDALRLVSFLGEYDLVVGTRARIESAGIDGAPPRQQRAELAGELSDRPRDSRSHVGFTSRADERPPRIPSPAAERILDADHDHAGVREGRLQREVRAHQPSAPRLGESKIKLVSDGARVPHDPAEGDHDLQPAANFLPISGAFFARRGLRHLDGHHAASHHQLVRAPPASSPW